MTQINYDDPMWGSGAFFKFVNDGDKITGNLVDCTTKTFEATADKAEQVCPVFHLEQSDGTVIEVTITNADLRKQLRALQPQIGNFVGMKRNRKVGNTVLFDVIVERARPVNPVPTTIADIDGPKNEVPF